jgi:hypothetical protein
MNTGLEFGKAVRGHRAVSQVVALLLLTGITVFGQLTSSVVTSPYDGTTPPAIAPGSPAGSYALSGFDTVDLYSGKLNLLLPLHSIKGRGEAAYNMVLPIQRNWNVLTQYNTDSVSQIPTTDMEPGHTPWADLPVQYYSVGLVAARSVHASFDPGQDHVVTCGYSTGVQYVPISTPILTRLTWKSADGSETELVDTQTGGQAIIQSPNCQNLWTTGYQGASRGTVFVSTDGSGLTFIAQSTVYDSLEEAPTGGGVQGTLFFPNGTRYTTDSTGNVIEITDRNGNMVTIQGGIATDPLGRTTTVTYAQFPTGATQAADTIQYSGYGGASKSITVNYGLLSNYLVSGQGLQTPACLFPELVGSEQTPFNPYVVTSVQLPNNTQYSFLYNSYAELAQVTLPTGGAIQYQWGSYLGAPTQTLNTAIGCTQPNSPSGVVQTQPLMIQRRVLSRAVLPSGPSGNVEQLANYSAQFGNGPTGTTVVTVQHMACPGTNNCVGASVLSEENHYFYDNPITPAGGVGAVGFGGFDDPTHYTPWQEAREYQTDSLNGSGAVLRSVANTWHQRSCGLYTTSAPYSADISCWYLAQEQQPVSYAAMPVHYAAIAETDTTLSDVSPALVSSVTYGYDQYNNRTQIKEYGYGSAPLSNLIRQTNRVFYTSGYDTYNSANPSASVYLRDLLQNETINDASGNPHSETTLSYDGGTLSSWGGSNGHNPAYSISYTTRGNVTTKTSYVSATASITQGAQYDTAGNVVTETDGNGYQSTITYISPDYSFPATVSKVVSGNTLTWAKSYDFSTGLVTDIKDPNQYTNSALGSTTYSYANDPLDRLTLVTRPNGGEIITYGWNDPMVVARRCSFR